MIGGTVVEYGQNPRGGLADFVLYHCTTHGVTQEAVFDESGTDMLYYRITVRVTGLVHGVTAWTQFSKRQFLQSGNSSAAFETRGLRAELDNRQTFRMRMGVTDDSDRTSGVELVYAEPWPDASVPAPAAGMRHWDVNDGPRCEVFAVDHVSDNTVFRVSATFTVCVVECDPASTGDPGTAKNNKLGILSNRWSSSDEIDVSYLTTRTYSGRLKVASSKINPHLLRAIVVPPLLQGLRRERMHFTVSVDGRTLDWSVTDKEVVAAAPAPARTWNISHIVDTDFAMLSSATCSVRLTGDRRSDPRAMLAIGFYVIEEKLQPARAGVITKRVTVESDLGEQNTVRVSWEAQLPAKNGNAKNVDVVILAALENVGAKLSLGKLQYNPNISRGAAPGDTIDIAGPISLTGIFHARLQSPCNDAHRTDPRSEGGSQNDGTWPAAEPTAQINPGTGPIVDIWVVENAITEYPSPILSPGHQSNPYSSYTSESLYESYGMRAAMPVARASTTTTAAPASGSFVSSAPLVDNTSAAVNGDEDTVKVIRLAAPVGKRIVRIKAERQGDWPVMPTPVDYQIYRYQTGTGNVPSGRAIVNDVRFLPGTVEVTPTGQRLFRAHLEIEYLLTRPVDTSQPLRVGVNPWDTLGLQLTSGAAMFAEEATP